MNGDKSILTVRCSSSSGSCQGVIEGTTENDQDRKIYTSEDMTSILRGYCYLKMCEGEENGVKISDYVFTNKRRELLHPDTFSRHLRRL